MEEVCVEWMEEAPIGPTGVVREAIPAHLSKPGRC